VVCAALSAVIDASSVVMLPSAVATRESMLDSCVVRFVTFVLSVFTVCGGTRVRVCVNASVRVRVGV